MGDGVAEPAGSCRGRKKNPLLTVESMVECSVLSAYEVETVVVNWVAVGVPWQAAIFDVLEDNKGACLRNRETGNRKYRRNQRPRDQDGLLN